MSYLNRKLGLVENLFEILHDLGAMIEVNAVRIEGPLTPTILQKALNLVQKRHPMLQVHIVDLADGAYFKHEGTSKIPLRVINKQHENQWLEITQEELHRQFLGGVEPLCRVTLISPSTNNGISEIIATFHHAIIDG
ncbi:condensation domain-containing protein, partial [Nostoc sp.]